MSYSEIFKLVAPEIITTLYMVGVTAIISLIIGIPLGIILTITRKNGIKSMPVMYSVLNWLVNIFRSIPFAILILLTMPLARFIIGKSIGTQAAILSLTVATIPFTARLMEGYFTEVNRGKIEAAKSMGSTNFQIVTKVIIPESMPRIIDGVTMVIINLIGYSAMVGVLGGGGLGQLAYRYGYQRKEYGVLIISVAIIIIIVQIVQFIGNYISKKIDRK